MQVALFYTCLVDLMRPSVGVATLQLLETAGCEVIIPEAQTCCGQPAFNSGDRQAARRLAEKVIAVFEPYPFVVVPSGSCADQIRNEYPGLFANDPAWRQRAEALAPKVYELTQFLHDVLKIDAVNGQYGGVVTYHDSCTGLRGLGIKAQPRALLAKVTGARLTEMAAPEECCGFGGTFAVKFGEISSAIAAKKTAQVTATGARAVVGGDVGCLLNIEGKLRREGDHTTEVLHIAEILAGVAEVRAATSGEN
jgi:L-lactate dehydrogenase complex protein LldE